MSSTMICFYRSATRVLEKALNIDEEQEKNILVRAKDNEDFGME